MLIKFNSLLLLLNLIPIVSASAQTRGKVRIVVSVDWEGRDLQAKNLDAMNSFRNDFPRVPLQHFLNAAYYTKFDADAEKLTQTIRSVLRPDDEHGLHIHAWRNLVSAAGVDFRNSPSFVKDDVNPAQCDPDCGNDIALTAYDESELLKIIDFSVNTLREQGFKRARSFRAGGWQADAHVLNALAISGFTLDSSATYAPYLQPSWGNYNLYPFVARLWPNTVPSSQPYYFKTSAGLDILEFPNNGCLADYMTGSAMLKAFVSNAKLLKQNPAKNVFLSIGFHQETAATYLPALRSGIDQIIKYAQTNDIAYEFVVAPF